MSSIYYLDGVAVDGHTVAFDLRAPAAAFTEVFAIPTAAPAPVPEAPSALIAAAGIAALMAARRRA